MSIPNFFERNCTYLQTRRDSSDKVPISIPFSDSVVQVSVSESDNAVFARFQLDCSVTLLTTTSGCVGV